MKEDNNFADVTLACEDGQQVQAHKVILAASSPFFEKILQNSKHPHPLIFLRGFQSKDLMAILDFFYFGEANICQENLNAFLEIAEELKVKGLSLQTFTDLPAEKKPHDEITKSVKKAKELFLTSTTYSIDPVSNVTYEKKDCSAKAISNLESLDGKVKSLMEKGKNCVPNGTQANGTPKQVLAFICKVCGKEGVSNAIAKHIEANHLEGISIPCAKCGKVFTSRNSLSHHKSNFHRSQA